MPDFAVEQPVVQTAPFLLTPLIGADGEGRLLRPIAGGFLQAVLLPYSISVRGASNHRCWNGVEDFGHSSCAVLGYSELDMLDESGSSYPKSVF